ncbi:MAG TPA: hypothetical protein VGU20_02100 [Stellaceae bacterium]|nr:hypothetical protein [Stellaceae bacterium]
MEVREDDPYRRRRLGAARLSPKRRLSRHDPRIILGSTASRRHALPLGKESPEV